MSDTRRKRHERLERRSPQADTNEARLAVMRSISTREERKEDVRTKKFGCKGSGEVVRSV